MPTTAFGVADPFEPVRALCRTFADVETTLRLPTVVLIAAGTLSACGRETTPTGPSGQTSFLAGTWRGTVTIQVSPRGPEPPTPTAGDMTWTFEVVPQTNMQSLRATIRSTHPWLMMDTTATTALSPSNSPPTRIEANFTASDCSSTFIGRVVLTKSCGEPGGSVLDQAAEVVVRVDVRASSYGGLMDLPCATTRYLGATVSAQPTPHREGPDLTT